MILTESNGGTRLSSTRYLHFGTVTTRRMYVMPLRFFLKIILLSVRTGRWDGVVTASITMSNIGDEIDWEFPGAQTTQAQTNYFWQGLIREPHFVALNFL
jgi:hypothetical protein